MNRPKPVALIILDGFGMRAETHGNAVAAAHKPNFDRYREQFPFTFLGASGEKVGLPDGQMGNSEVGHLNLGAGRVVYQDLTRVTKAIRDGDLFRNPALLGAVKQVQERASKLHLIGLLSDGGVHSHLDHLLALLDFAKQNGLSRVYLHAILDGRDVLPYTARGFLRQTLDKMAALGLGQIATVTGRYYAMDRDRRWERTEKAYRAMVYGEGERARDPLAGLEASFERSVTDEFVLPIVVVDESDKPVGVVDQDDAAIVFNFRPDRMIQISQALTNAYFPGFDRGSKAPLPHVATLTHVSDSVQAQVAYPPTTLEQTLGEVVSQAGLVQLRIAETEKFPHVTSFFSGGREAPFSGEERVLIPSPKVATYDLQPEMSAPEVALAAAGKVRSGAIDLMILNFANPDMVGHTGIMEAAIKAVEAADTGLGQVVDAILERGGAAVIIADHGNAEVMIDPESGSPCTTHTTNPVPCIVTLPGVQLRDGGILADIAPTLLDLLQMPQPSQMTGRSLIVRSAAADG